MDNKTVDDITALLLGTTGVLLLSRPIITSAQQIPTYSYDINVNLTTCKWWQFIEPNLFRIVLNNGDSIRIRLDISSVDPLDIVDIRFHNVCNNSFEDITAIGKIFAFVDGRPALPTIGIQPQPTPIYFAFPRCPTFGTVQTTIWDTDDTRRIGPIEYLYIYEGAIPLIIKTLELYITKNK